MKNSYEILGLDSSATMEEVENAYRALKEEYGEKRFEPGEAGDNAARKLTEVEAAYREIKEIRAQSETATHSQDDFSAIEAALRAGDLNQAQALLDLRSDRNAEWHYLQSYVYYKKNWMNESKKQLEISVSMDGGNEKYRKALADLNAKMQRTGQTVYTSGNASSQHQPYGGQQMGGDSLSTCCTTWACCQCLSCLCR
jgi:curved DNA-binding protein CbpA